MAKFQGVVLFGGSLLHSTIYSMIHTLSTAERYTSTYPIRHCPVLVITTTTVSLEHIEKVDTDNGPL